MDQTPAGRAVAVRPLKDCPADVRMRAMRAYDATLMEMMPDTHGEPPFWHVLDVGTYDDKGVHVPESRWTGQDGHPIGISPERFFPWVS